jgi:4-aminobutyrate aminotransferase-like enzyme
MPPLMVDEATIDEAMTILEASLSQVTSQL